MVTNSGANLRVRISADLGDIKQGLSLLRGELAKVKADSGRVQPDTKSWQNGLAAVRKQLLGIVSVYGALRAMRAYVDLSDQAANLSGRLRLVTKDADGFNRAYRGTYKLAQDTRADWASVVGLFAQLSQTTGQSQERILSLTQVISQAFRVSGASAEETSNGLRQLQQAMAGGVLRAEEFNTIIETSPRIVQALADHFKISFGQVRKYVNDGKVTTQEFMAALEESADSIERDFNKLPKTVSGSVQQVRNALVALVGDANDASGASQDLAQAISTLAGVLSDPTVKEGFNTIILGVTNAATGFAALVGEINNASKKFQEWLNLQAGGNRKYGGENLAEQHRELVAINEELERRKTSYITGLSALGLQSENALRKRKQQVESLIELNEMLFGDPDKPQVRFSDSSTMPDSMLKALPTPGEDPAGSTKKQVAISNALMRDSVTRALAELDRLYKSSEIGIQQYFRTRTELQQKLIDLQIREARGELAAVVANSAGDKDKTKSLEQRRKLEEQIAILQRDRADVAMHGLQEEKEASDAMIQKLGDVKAQLEELDGNAGEAARIRIYAQFHDLFKQLEANSDETGKKMVENLVDRLVNKAQADAIAGKVSQATGLLSSQEQSISAQMDAGTLGYTEGERRLQEARQATMDQLRKLRAEQEAYLASLSEDSPDIAAARQGLESIDESIANVTASLHQFRQGVEDQAVNALGGFFDDLIDGAKSFKDAFRDMVANFLAGVAKMIAQQLALNAVKAIGRAFGAAHGGGIAGQLRMIRNNIDPMVFAAAPRYHGGGIAGLQNDEIPAILQRGEVIRTRQQEQALQARMNGAGGGNAQPIRNIIVFSDDELAAALEGAAGEKVVVNHARRNRMAISG